MAYKGRKKSSKKDKEYDETNRGVMFDNAENKEENEARPDWRGHINIEGVEYWISGWQKDTKVGEVISLSVQPKDDDAPKSKKSKRRDDEDEDEDERPARKSKSKQKPKSKRRDDEDEDYDDIPF